MSRLTLKACASAALCRLDMNDAFPVKVTPALVTTLFAGASLFAIPAVAQSYPSKPVRLIVPFALGGRPGSRRRGCCWGGDGARPPGLWHCILQRLATALFAGASLFALAAVAQSYPSKPVRLIVPFAPGGGADLMGRALGQRLSLSLKQPVVIDNRAGAGGRIAAELAARSAPDGYTLFLGTSTTLVFAPALYPMLAYDPVRDFFPIAPFATAIYVLVVNPAVRARSVKELIALAKAEPGALKYASSGDGGPAHLAAELLNFSAGIKTLHIAYKGSAPGTIAVVGGETDMMFSNILPALPLIKSGRIRSLGVSSLKRSPALPDVPTVSESGVPGFEVYIFYGLVAPARTPREIIDRLHAQTLEAMQLPEVKARLASEGGESMSGTPDEFARIIKSELGKWSKVIQAAGLRGE